MQPLFLPGDVVAIRRQPTARVGDLVVARLGDGAMTFKRFGGRTEQGLVFLPLNPAVEPIIDLKAEIVGVYRWLHRQAPG